MLAHVLMLLFLVAAALVLLGSIQADQKKPVMERQDRRDGGHDGLTAREKLLKRQQEEKAMAAAVSRVSSMLFLD